MNHSWIRLTTTILVMTCLIPYAGLAGENAEQVAARWVAVQNRKLPKTVAGYIEGWRGLSKRQQSATMDKSKLLIREKKVDTKLCHHWNIPPVWRMPEKDWYNGMKYVELPVSALYEIEAQGQSFALVDYTDKMDDLNSRSELYWKVGEQYKLLFGSGGLDHSIQLLSLGKNSPVFIEVESFGGGSGSGDEWYVLLPGAPKLEVGTGELKIEKNVRKVLDVGSWQDGFVAYRDFDGDGMFEIFYSSHIFHPEDLESLLGKLADWDDVSPRLYRTSIYKWNGKEFADLGDQYAFKPLVE